MTATTATATAGPLAGVLVVDLSRMLPGAVLARQLIDLGARLIKVEDPTGGDPMRAAPPIVGGVGAGFATLLRGSESVCLDLRSEAGAAAVLRLAKSADVVVESFRTGTTKRWGLDAESLLALNPRLVYCSLSSYGHGGEWAERVGHDLNFVATSGLLSLLPGTGVPAVQLADVTAALLATSGILAALLARQQSGRGAVIEQPLAAAPLPFLAWAWADAAAGGAGVLDVLLAGDAPCYRRYPCGDRLELAVAVIEPKFWGSFLDMLGLPHLAGAGFDPGDEGRRAAREIGEVLASRPRAHWLEEAAARSLPISAVHDLASARIEGPCSRPGIEERITTPDGEVLSSLAPWIAFGRTPVRPVPALGEHTAAVLKELGIAH
jgi:alpha-methylacyl-CoA racemase